jgi:hypothetical protein
MARSMALVLPAILASASFAPAQYYYPPAAPSSPQALVATWYEHYLGRQPDAGAASWVRSLQMGRPPEQVLSTILSSQEYLRRAGGTRPGFIQQLYLDIAGRQPSPQELGYWMGRMRFDSRKDVAYQLLIFFPQDWSGGRGPAAPYNPGYYPEPASPTYSDPAGRYFRSPSYYNYEYRRPVRALPPLPPR